MGSSGMALNACAMSRFRRMCPMPTVSCEYKAIRGRPVAMLWYDSGVVILMFARWVAPVRSQQ
jgi:hypothetical protein